MNGLRFTLLIAILSVAGCSGDDNSNNDTKSDISITNIQISEVTSTKGAVNSGSSVATGFPVQYKAVASYSDGSQSDITQQADWTVEDNSVAMISTEGTALGIETGDTQVQAQLESISSNQVHLSVTDATLESLEVIGRDKLIVGIPVQLEARAHFDDQTVQAVTHFVEWYSSDNSVATITHDGQITPLAEGRTDVFAYYRPLDYTSDIPLNVRVFETPVSGDITLSLTPAEASIAQGTSAYFRAFIEATLSESEPAISFDVTDQVHWLTEHPDYIEMDETVNGRAKGHSPIEEAVVNAELMVRDHHLISSGTLSVKDAVLETVHVDCNATEIPLGLSAQCSATASFSQEEDIPVEEQEITDSSVWLSDNTDSFTVSDGGEISSHAVGSGNVKATYSSVDGYKEIQITDAQLQSVSVLSKGDSVIENSTMQMAAIGTLSDDSQISVTNSVAWSVDNSNAASISGSGVLSAKSVDIDTPVIVTASVGDSLSYSLSASKTITVTEYSDILPTCGEINDSDPNNASGDCLKVISDATGKLLASTPGIGLITKMGYTESSGDDDTSPKSYAGSIYDSNIEESFARFDQLGTDGGQLNRWCRHLSSINFAMRSNWQVATFQELQQAHNEHGDLYSKFGWPATWPYWSSSLSEGEYHYFSLMDGYTQTAPPDDSYYAACASEKT